MSASIANLDSGYDVSGSATSITTASLTLTAGFVYYLWVSSFTGSGADNVVPTCTGWTKVTTSGVADLTNDYYFRLTLFRRLGDDSSGTHTIDFAGHAHASIMYSVDKATGVDLTGTNGAGSIIQAVGATGSSTTPSATLSAFADATNNLTYFGGFIAYSSDPGMAEEGGFTLLLKQKDGARCFTGEYLVGQHLAPSVTGSALYPWDGLALELKYAPATASAALTGTATAGITETDIVAGGKVLTLTLVGDTFIAA